MHILVIAPGHVIHTKRLICSLLDHGHRVSALSPTNPLAGASGKYQFIPWPGIRGFHRLNTAFTSQLEFPIRVRQISQVWKQLRPDLVNVQGVDIRAAYCGAAGIHPLVLTCWGADINDLFEKNVNDEGYLDRVASLMGASYYLKADKEYVLYKYRQRIGKALKRADLVTAVTPEILSRCEQLAGRKLHSRLFRFGVDFSLFHDGYREQGLKWRRELGISENAKVLLSVRTIQPLFGHEHVLEAFAQAVSDAQLPETVLVFQQKYSFPIELDRLRARVKELSLASKVFWLPEFIPVDRLPIQYAMSDIVINYPAQDGFPVSLLEAVACKRPVICSELAAYEGTFCDSLVMVPPGNADALAGAIKQTLLDDEVHQRDRIEKALAVARRIGDQEKNFDSLFEMFNEAMNRFKNN